MNHIPSPHEPQPLRFEPDEKRLARLARFRRIVLWSTLGLMVLALVLVLLMPSRIMVVSDEAVVPVSEPVPASPAVSPSGDDRPAAVPTAPPVSRQLPAVPAPGDPQVEAAGLVRTIDSLGSLAREQWRRAGGMVTAITVRQENVPEIMKRIGIARAIGDSARLRLARAEEALERLKGLLRVSGVAGTRINAAYASAREYVVLLGEEASDRQGWLDSYEQAILALSDSNVAQFEIKMNVAGAYERQSDVRQRRLSRAAELLRNTAAGLK